nr:unnamed protein product [Callosobruchus chinensis]
MTNETLTLVSVYIQPQTKITVREWTSFFDFFSSPFVIGGDFNSHHVSWGSRFTDLYGKNLLDSLHQCNLMFINDGSPTYINSNRRSAIDVTVCSPQISHLLSWHIMSDTCGSDHLPILIGCGISPYKYNIGNGT